MDQFNGRLKRSRLTRFNRQALMSEGFRGFVTVQDLSDGKLSEIPTEGGVYVVLREVDAVPAFLSTNPGGWFKGKDPTVSRSELISRWVASAHAVYIGKGDDKRDKLRGRLRKF